MISFLNALLFIAAATAIGRALLPRQTVAPRSRGEEIAVSYNLGIATIIFVTQALFLINIKLSFIFWLILALAIIAFIYKRKQAEVFAKSSFSYITCALLILVGFASGLAAISYPLNEFDPIYHWAYRGKILLFEGTPLTEAITGIISSDNFGRVITHPNYPLGIPIIQALSSCLGGFSERFAQLPLAAWTATLPWVLAFGLRNFGPTICSSIAIMTVATPILFVSNFTENGFEDLLNAGTSSSMMLGGGADLAVMSMLTLGLSLFTTSMRINCRRLAICSGIALAGASAMKNEGLALTIVIFIAIVLAYLFARKNNEKAKRKLILFFLVTTMTCTAPWLLIRGQLPAIDENYSEQLTINNVIHFITGGPELIEKSPLAMSGRGEMSKALAEKNANEDNLVPTRRSLVSYAFWEEFTDWRSWGLLWALMLIAIAVNIKDVGRFNMTLISLTAVGGLLLYFLILLVTPWNFPSLRDKGIPERLFVHLAGIILLSLGYAFSQLERSKNKLE